MIPGHCCACDSKWNSARSSKPTRFAGPSRQRHCSMAMAAAMSRVLITQRAQPDERSGQEYQVAALPVRIAISQARPIYLPEGPEVAELIALLLTEWFGRLVSRLHSINCRLFRSILCGIKRGGKSSKVAPDVFTAVSVPFDVSRFNPLGFLQVRRPQPGVEERAQDRYCAFFDERERGCGS